MYKFQNILEFCKKSEFILGLILVGFFLKGLLLVCAFPIFGGQDESRHYNTIQYLSEPKEKSWTMQKQENEQAKDRLDTYHYSQEIQKTAIATDTDILRGENFNTIDFSSNYIGKNETEINQRQWKPYNFINPPDVVSNATLYHSLGTFIEKAVAGKSILVRFYLIRIFSVFLGTLVVLCAYLIAKNSGFSKRHSLILTAIISFQPKFSFYYSNINYDVLLILMFTLFTFFGILALKNGLNWKNLLLLIFSLFIAIKTKQTGMILLVPFIFLLTYFFYLKFKSKFKQHKKLLSLSIFICFFIVTILVFKVLSIDPANLGTTFFSINNYLSKTLTLGRFGLSARTYWGTLSWVNSWFMDYIINFIWLVEFFALIGLGFFFFGKYEKPKFLPEKKYLVFLLGMLIILQLGIRAADWKLFSYSEKIEIGTPGRYFLPNLTAHILLLFSGLGMFLARFKKERYFEKILRLGMILMFSFTLYLIFDVVLFRFYL